MNLEDLSKIVAKETGEPVYKIETILNTSIKVIRAQIIKAQVIKLKGLLTMFIDVIPERRIYNVAKNEYCLNPRRFALRIMPSVKLKKEIRAKKTY
jgi:nucleoid DNA-binding protein